MQQNNSCLAILRQKAQQLLAQREHGKQELIQKLQQKHPSCQDWVLSVVASLEDDDWLNEARYVDAFIRKEIRLGHGPRHIQAALKQKGVGAESIQQGLDDADVDWLALAQQVYHKKYGNTPAEEMTDIAKRQRFLTYRGFDAAMVRQIIQR